jgi:3-keto-disaccharide hydrolase
VQVLDNFTNPTSVNGMVGSIYRQYPPLVNATLPAETWNVYDIVFNVEGSLASPARFKVLHNLVRGGTLA